MDKLIINVFRVKDKQNMTTIESENITDSLIEEVNNTEEPKPEPRTLTIRRRKVYKCMCCNKIFNNSGDLIKHQKLVRAKKAAAKKTTAPVPKAVPIKYSHTCTKCFKVSTYASPKASGMCASCIAKERLTSKKFKCYICKKVRTYTGNKAPNQCTDCEDTFTMLASRFSVRPGIKLPKCEECDEIFIDKDMLKKHMKKNH